MRAPEVHVALTSFGGLNNPQPGMPVAKALREGWRGPLAIHALGQGPLMTGAWMPNVADELHLIPPLGDGDEALFKRLVEIRGRHRLDVLIPCFDLEVPAIAWMAHRLEKVGIKTLLPSPEAVYSVAKLRLPVFCYENKVRAPRTIHVMDITDLPLHAKQFGFPLMVKGTVAGAKRVTSVDQAVMEAKELARRWGGGVLLQEAISGVEICVAAVMGRSGGRIGLVAMRKLGVNPHGKGIFGAVIDDPEVEREAARILDCLDWQGPVELEFIRPHGSDKLYLLEINCRFPSWIMLSHFAGCNLPVGLVREILRLPGRRRTRPRPGTSFLRDIKEIAVPLEDVTRLSRLKSLTTAKALPAPKRRPAPEPIRVAVTGLGTADVINPGLGAAAALRRAPEIGRIYGLGYGSVDSGLYRGDIFDAVFRLPAKDEAEPLRDKLLEIHREAPFDVVIPCLDAEIPRFLSILGDLDRLGVKTLLPSRKAFERRTKAKLFTGGIKRDWGAFEIPETVRIRSERSISRAVRHLGLPVVVKGPISESITAKTVEEAHAAWWQLREKGYQEALIQPFVAGDYFAVAAVCDRDYEARAMLSVKKLLTCDRGSTWSAINTRPRELEASFAGFLKDLQWSGPVEGEFIRDETRERFFLIEVNPRFTAWISFSAFLGVNHPLLSVCLALDRAFEPGPLNSELIFMRSCVELPLRARDLAALSTKGCLYHG